MNPPVWRAVHRSAPFWSSTTSWCLEAGQHEYWSRDRSACSRMPRTSSPRCSLWGEAWQPEPVEPVQPCLLPSTLSFAGNFLTALISLLSNSEICLLYDQQLSCSQERGCGCVSLTYPRYSSRLWRIKSNSLQENSEYKVVLRLGCHLEWTQR